MTETFIATLQVKVLSGKGRPPAGTECCVVRGRLRLRSVHRERAGRVIEPRKSYWCGADVVERTEGSIARVVMAGYGWSAGVEERGMYAGVVQEPGRPRFLHCRYAVRAPHDKWSRLLGTVSTRGSEQRQSGGSAKRRQRSAARWETRSRSLLIVPMKSGNPPQGTRWREAADRIMLLLEG